MLLPAAGCCVRTSPSPTSLVCRSNKCIGCPMFRMSQRATTVSDDPVASKNSLNGLKAKQLMFAECACAGSGGGGNGGGGWYQRDRNIVSEHCPCVRRFYNRSVCFLAGYSRNRGPMICFRTHDEYITSIHHEGLLRLCLSIVFFRQNHERFLSHTHTHTILIGSFSPCFYLLCPASHKERLSTRASCPSPHLHCTWAWAWRGVAGRGGGERLLLQRSIFQGLFVLLEYLP